MKPSPRPPPSPHPAPLALDPLPARHQVGAFVERSDRSLQLPYRIEGKDGLSETINGLSIVTGGVSEDEWTRALKFLMTNLKRGPRARARARARRG